MSYKTTNDFLRMFGYYSLEELQAVHEYWRSMNRYSKQVLNKEKVA